MDKQRIDPTHFIEVYSTKKDFSTGETKYGGILRIRYLKHCLEFTNTLNDCYTVAIFKIVEHPYKPI